jgi:hypothetical protein
MSGSGSAHHWLLRDRAGNELRSTEPFESQAAAEEWLSQEWSSLRDEGAESVVLMEGGTEIYDMSLLEADPE